MARTENRIEKKKDFCLASSIVMLLISHYFSPPLLLLLDYDRFASAHCCCCCFDVNSMFLSLSRAPICKLHDISRNVYNAESQPSVQRERAEASSIVGILSMLDVHSNLSLPKPQPLLRISEMVSDSLRSRKKECNGKCLEETKTIGRQSFFVTRFSFFLFSRCHPRPSQPASLSCFFISEKISILQVSFHYWNRSTRLPLC